MFIDVMQIQGIATKLNTQIVFNLLKLTELFVVWDLNTQVIKRSICCIHLQRVETHTNGFCVQQPLQSSKANLIDGRYCLDMFHVQLKVAVI